MVVLGEKNEIKKDFVHDTAVYMGNLKSFLGAVIFIKLRKYPHMRYRGCVDTRWNISSGLSLGLFIFTPGEEDEDSQKIRVHEYGHCIQSIVLGPLYMLLGIISIVWPRHPYFEMNPQRKEFAIYCLLCRSMGKQMGRSIYRRKRHMELGALMWWNIKIDFEEISVK